MTTTNSPKTYNRVIQIHCDEQMYDNFQRLRRQKGESSDASLGRKIIKQYLTEELDGAGTQRHFQATYQDHLNRNDWIALFNLYMLTSMYSRLTKQTSEPQSARDIFQDISSSFATGFEKLNAEITRLIDETADK